MEKKVWNKDSSSKSVYSSDLQTIEMITKQKIWLNSLFFPVLNNNIKYFRPFYNGLKVYFANLRPHLRTTTIDDIDKMVKEIEIDLNVMVDSEFDSHIVNETKNKLEEMWQMLLFGFEETGMGMRKKATPSEKSQFNKAFGERRKK